MIGGMNNPKTAPLTLDKLIEGLESLKGLDLRAGAKEFRAAAKKAGEDADRLVKAAADADFAKAKLVKAETSLTRRESRLKSDREAWKKTKEEEQSVFDAREADIAKGELQLANAVSAVKERETRATEALAAADVRMDAAKRIQKAAQALEASLKPKLDLIEQLRA